MATSLGNVRPPFGPLFIAVSRPSLIGGTSSARVNFSKFRRNFQRPSGDPLPSLSPSSIASSGRCKTEKKRKQRDGGRRQKEGKVATTLSRMHNSRPCPWTDGSSEFNDLDAPRPWRKVCIRDHDGEHNRGSKTVSLLPARLPSRHGARCFDSRNSTRPYDFRETTGAFRPERKWKIHETSRNGGNTTA